MSTVEGVEAEDAKLKRIVADQLLNIEGLKELSRGRMKVKLAPVGLLARAARCQSATARS